MVKDIFENLDIPLSILDSGELSVFSPNDGSLLAQIKTTDVEQVDTLVSQASEAFNEWKTVPAPMRGELVRLLGEELRKHKTELAKLVSVEAGKITEEGLGEVQEMIDICEFAVGLSRQLYGLTIASERPGHHMRESWHPLGVVGVISAFNFPVAVWSWNTALAIVCGNPVIWKPSEKTPLTAIACQYIFEKAVKRFQKAPKHLSQLLIGDAAIGKQLVANPAVALVSATGSTQMGKNVGPQVLARFGRQLLELGGNNAMILAPSADLDLAVRAITFSAVGTAGQRCTSLRRLIVHDSVADKVIEKLKNIFASLKVGHPLEGNLVGPLIDQTSFDNMQAALKAAKQSGGIVSGGQRVLQDMYPKAYYVNPAIVELESQCDVMKTETFAPILYVVRYSQLQQAIEMQNDVPQGLSSCIFTNDLREAELFLSASGSDCGIANVNIGTSGAEIGGAFGGEKETGGGRESGSDAWKNYMRRQTNTINYSTELPLAQGITFE